MRTKLTLGVAALSVLALTACGGPGGTTSTGAPEEPGETGAEAQHTGQFRRRRAGARLQQRRGTGEQTGSGQKQDGEADGVRRVDRTVRGRAGR